MKETGLDGRMGEGEKKKAPSSSSPVNAGGRGSFYFLKKKTQKAIKHKKAPWMRSRRQGATLYR